jgi:hypothetical protein
MTFLDQENVDVYVSTWDSTHHVSPKIGLDIIENVSSDEISRILNRSAEILVESTEIQKQLRPHYNCNMCNMIHRWKRGIQMIVDSGVKYDYVLITRFDLCYDPSYKISLPEIISECSDETLISSWTDDNRLGDLFMLSTYNKMIEFMMDLTILKWLEIQETDWHIWLSQFAKSFFDRVVNITTVHYTICRYFSKKGDDFTTISQHHCDWRDIKICEIILHSGKIPENIWPKGVAENALLRYKSGEFEKYKNHDKEKKIAVLISGEYRAFDICRPTMTFLDQENVDVYISTWDSTHHVSPKIGLDIIENVSSDEISRILNRPAEILVESTEIQKQLRPHYNCNMIHRWKQGIQMIVDSGIEYDYVIVTRFDLYFDPSFDINISEILQYSGYNDDDTLGSSWARKSYLGDEFMIASYKKMVELMSSLTIEKWAIAPENKWHIWFGQFAESIFTNVNRIAIARHIICRCLYKLGDDYSTIVKYNEDWDDLKILHIMEIVGKDWTLKNKQWSISTIERAEQKWADGYFDKYKNYVKDNQ